MTNITRDPKILGGKPIVRGTRISVNFILEELAAGVSIDELLEGYPQLTREFIQEAFAYAAEDIERTDVRSFLIPV
ncbi:MAG: DUF433 domain-containing protein [Candidatus Uhrbacteria bacterium]|nr:DUF433 domain-containing protein [Candidatus Uhrbacteria bacterium]